MVVFEALLKHILPQRVEQLVLRHSLVLSRGYVVRVFQECGQLGFDGEELLNRLFSVQRTHQIRFIQLVVILALLWPVALYLNIDALELDVLEACLRRDVPVRSHVVVRAASGGPRCLVDEVKIHLFSLVVSLFGLYEGLTAGEPVGRLLLGELQLSSLLSEIVRL